MGNKLTCCWRKQDNESNSNNRRQRTLEDKYLPSHHGSIEVPAKSISRQLSSSTNLQHISEREPDGKIACHVMLDIKINQSE